MTTTVTIKTHDRPALVRVEDRIDFSSAHIATYGHSSTSNFVPPDVEQQFVVTDAQLVIVEELREGVTSIEDVYSGARSGAALNNQSAGS